MAGSVSKTYLKLKELILEKKSLVTEIERLRLLNVELVKRVEQQESRLSGVSTALHQTWIIGEEVDGRWGRLRVMPIRSLSYCLK